MRRPAGPVTAAALAVLLLAADCAPAPERPPAEPARATAERRTAEPPEPTASEWPLPAPGGADEPERAMSVGEIHRHAGDLAAGDYLEVVVEQLGIDVEVDLLGPDGRSLLPRAADSPTNGTGHERLGAVAAAGGRHTVEVRPFGGIDSAGRYRLRVVTRRPARETDRLRAAAFAALARGESLRRGGAASADAALAALHDAAGLWTRLGDPRGRGLSLYEIGRVERLQTGEGGPALDAWERAAAALRAAGESALEGEVHHHLGDLHAARGDLRRALGSYRSALERRRAAGDRIEEAKLLNQLALVHFRLREPETALDHLDRAIGRWRELAVRAPAAAPLHNRAWVYLHLGRLREAERDFSRARSIAEEAGRAGPAANALLGLAHVERRRATTPPALRSDEVRDAALDRALGLYRRALAELDGPEHEFERAVALGGIGGTLAWQGRWRESRAALEASLARFRELGGPREEGQIHLDLAEWAARQGDQAAAVDSVRRALPLLVRAGDDDGRAAALSWLARSERAGGRLAEATATLEEAVAIVESLRAAAPPGGTLRASFLASKQNYFEELVDLLMERHALEPQRGFDARALEIHERSRARSLLDAAAAAGAGGGQRLGHPLRAAAIAGLLDDRTLLVVYHLGPRRSFAWTVDRRGVESFVLPARAEIEALALEAHRLLASPPARRGLRRTETVLGRASAVLLSPLTERPAPRAQRAEPPPRLVIVAHGALQYLPFAALPLPTAAGTGTAGGGEPLIARYELSHLPSASLLAALRERDRHRPPAAGTVAVIADPVFGPDDERAPRREGVAPADRRGGDDALPRLERTRDEAEAILALVPSSEAFAAFGFDATADLLTGGLSASYRIVHLATHGEIDASGAGRSRLVFSRLGAGGEPRDGVLHADELYGLDLPADLVVLSACRTALGEEIRGEGLVGLAHGFFHAGASRLLASLWSVDDAATAELMSAFYRELLAGAEPAAALRAAQLGVRREPAWRSPYYWTPFVLEGDWRWR